MGLPSVASAIENGVTSGSPSATFAIAPPLAGIEKMPGPFGPTAEKYATEPSSLSAASNGVVYIASFASGVAVVRWPAGPPPPPVALELLDDAPVVSELLQLHPSTPAPATNAMSASIFFMASPPLRVTWGYEPAHDSDLRDATGGTVRS